jgi:putative membrane protein
LQSDARAARARHDLQKELTMKTLVLVAALLVLPAPLNAQNATDQMKNGQPPTQASAATQMFAKTVAITDMFEIQAGQLAQEKVQDQTYKDFAQMIVKDHAKTSNELKGMNVGVPLPQDLDSIHKTKIDKLNSLSGVAFERQFKTDQIEGHKQAVAEFDQYAKRGDNPQLKQWAQTTLPALKTHLEHAEALPQPASAPTVGSGKRQ